MLKIGSYTFNAGGEQKNINIQWDGRVYSYAGFIPKSAQRIVIKFCNIIIFHPLIDWLTCGSY
jgi:hypothetical protein